MNSKIELSDSHNDTGNFMVKGAIDFDSLQSLNRHASELFPRFKRIIVDLSGVTYVNSAGLALLLEWKRMAAVDNKTLELRGVPEKLRNIARMSELGAVLPLQDTDN